LRQRVDAPAASTAAESEMQPYDDAVRSVDQRGCPVAASTADKVAPATMYAMSPTGLKTAGHGVVPAAVTTVQPTLPSGTPAGDGAAAGGAPR